MLVIDGSSGGGQMLRTALSLSVLEELPFRLEGVRSNRPDSGLKRQHLAAIDVMQQLSNADVDGAELGSEEVVFEPGGMSPREVHVDIGTAGSVSLLFQTVLPLTFATDEPFLVRAEGGTDVKWSPPVDYLDRVALPVLRRFGVDADLRVARRGFYPDGGGIARLDVASSEPEEVVLDERGGLKRVEGVSIASQHLRDSQVAQRQRSEARRVVRNAFPSTDIDVEEQYVQSSSPGSSIVLAAVYGDTVLGADALGEKGKRSEQVGKEASESLVERMGGPGVIDPWMADQLIPYIGISGGEVLLPRVTDHVSSCIEVVEAFLGVEIGLEERDGGVLARRV